MNKNNKNNEQKTLIFITYNLQILSQLGKKSDYSKSF